MNFVDWKGDAPFKKDGLHVNIKECVLNTISDLVGKVKKRTRKPWITQEMIS